MLSSFTPDHVPLPLRAAFDIVVGEALVAEEGDSLNLEGEEAEGFSGEEEGAEEGIATGSECGGGWEAVVSSAPFAITCNEDGSGT